MPKLPESVTRLYEHYGTIRQGDCILLQASLDSHGYPAISVKGQRWIGSRYVAREAIGPVKGRVVMHTCDTPQCVNPAHLRIGTQRENIADRVRKGRNGACRGEEAPWSKLTEEAVRQIRACFERGDTRADIISRFGISKTQLYRVVNRESWRHV